MSHTFKVGERASVVKTDSHDGGKGVTVVSVLTNDNGKVWYRCKVDGRGLEGGFDASELVKIPPYNHD